MRKFIIKKIETLKQKVRSNGKCYKIYFHICEEERTNPSSVFEVKALEAMYIDLLKNDQIYYGSQISHFAE